MRRKPVNTMVTQTTATEPELLTIKMESMNLEDIAKEREKEIKAEILSDTLRQERLKNQLEECSRNRRQASAIATSADGGTSCQGATASRRTADADDDNTDDWQAELLHNVDEDTFEKLDGIAADLDEMATREQWLFCRSCKAWHTVLCSKTSSKFLMLSILGLLLQTRPINAADMQGKGDYSIADSHGVAVYEHRYDAVLDASTSIIVIEMPFWRLRAEMGKLRAAMEKASKEYDQERELFMFRKRIITGLLAATFGPRTMEPITAVVQATTEEHEVKKEKATGTKQKGRDCRQDPRKRRKGPLTWRS
jgi:hypothetical protein